MWLKARRAISTTSSTISWYKVVEFVFGFPGDLQDLGQWLEWIRAQMIGGNGIWVALAVGTLIWAVLEWYQPVRRYLAQQVPGRKREYTRLTAAEILAKFKDQTDAEVRRMLQPHFGLWLRRIDGSVVDVVESPDTTTVLIRLELGGYYGKLDFSTSSKEAAAVRTLPVGERVTATGLIHAIDRRSVWLNQCELTDE